MRLFFLVAAILIVTCRTSYSQRVVNLDSLAKSYDLIETFQSKSTLDPNMASLYAAVFPGGGQIYNRQYWKLPIVYGGLMIFGHYINNSHQLYSAFLNAYRAETDKDPATINPFPQYSTTILERNAQTLRRNRDYLTILMVVYYLVSIAEAHISTHLIEFDVNDDLSFEVRPTMYNRNRYTAQNIGVSLVFSLNK